MYPVHFIKQPLICRTSLLPGESLTSLLIRLAERNSYGSLADLQALLQDHDHPRQPADNLEFPSKPATYEKLAILTGLDVVSLYKATHHRFASILLPPPNLLHSLQLPAGISAPHFAQGYYPKQLRLAVNLQFCPKCLSEEAYYTLQWSPLAISACLQHECLLVDRCLECGQGVSLPAIVKARCSQCRANLSKTRTFSIRDDELGLLVQEIIQALLMGLPLPESATSLLPNQPVAALYRLLDDLHEVLASFETENWPYMHRPPGKPRPFMIERPRNERVLTPYLSYQLYTTACKALIRWPQGFYELLDNYHNKIEADGAGHKLGYSAPPRKSRLIPGKISDSLDILYSKWLCRRWKSQDFSFVQEAFNAYVADHYWLNCEGDLVNFCKKHPELAERAKSVSILDAAEWLKMSPSKIESLLGGGQLAPKKNPADDPTKLVSKEQVFSLRREQKQPMPLGSVVRFLGLNESIIKDLARVGLVEARYRVELNDWLPVDEFTSSSVVAFLDKVSHCTKECLPQSEEGDWLSLAEVSRKLSTIHLDVVTIFLELVSTSRTLQVYHPADQPLRLRNILFRLTDIEAFIKAMKPKSLLVASRKTAEILGTRERILMLWVRKGLIIPSAVYGYDMYFEPACIDKFKREHPPGGSATELIDMEAVELSFDQLYWEESKLEPTRQ